MVEGTYMIVSCTKNNWYALFNNNVGVVAVQYECLVEKRGEKFPNAADRREHMIVVHKFPPKFKFDRIPKPDSHISSNK